MPLGVGVFERDAEKMILADGWRISQGPNFNSNLLSKKGAYVWSIKSALSPKDLKARGIKGQVKDTKPRTVRFLGKVENGVLLSLSHLTSSGRKRIGKGRRRGKGTPEGNSPKEAKP
jgi:hypothetical protein